VSRDSPNAHKRSHLPRTKMERWQSRLHHGASMIDAHSADNQ